MVKTSENLYLRGFKEFRCAGNECLDNCCDAGNWRIQIDDDTYKKYLSVEGEFGEYLRNNILEENGITRFKAYENKQCKLIDENGLCQIHKNLGEDYLCFTCKVYPRGTIERFGNKEHLLMISCPVVCEEILFSKEKLALFNENNETYIEELEDLRLCSEENELIENILKRIKSLSIKIMQDRDIELWKRLIIVGVMIESAYEVISADTSTEVFTEELEKTLKMYENNYKNSDFLNSIDSLKDGNLPLAGVVYGKIVKEIFNAVFSFESVKDNHNNREYFEKFKILDIEEKKSFFVFHDSKKANLKKYMDENEYVFENFLVWQIFNSSFPSFDKSIMYSYYNLVLKYLILQSLIVYLADGEEITDKDVLNSSYFVAKRIFHNDILDKKIEDFYDELKDVTVSNEAMRIVNKPLLDLSSFVMLLA